MINDVENAFRIFGDFGMSSEKLFYGRRVAALPLCALHNAHLQREVRRRERIGQRGVCGCFERLPLHVDRFGAHGCIWQANGPAFIRRQNSRSVNHIVEAAGEILLCSLR